MTAKVVLHAGMAKAGSTSIQRWLTRNLEPLRARDIQPMRLVRDEVKSTFTLVPATSHGAASVMGPQPAGFSDPHRPAMVERICDAIDTGAPPDGVVVISGEVHESIFHHADLESLATLDAFSQTHDLRIAYYVRPQDSALMAAWLQWGFRSALAPDQWVHWNDRRLNYARTWATVKAGAPHLCFEMRPFRLDLLRGHTPVSDFASEFLGLRDTDAFAEQSPANRSIALEMAILLRAAPPEMFWRDDHDHDVLDRLKDITESWKMPDTEIAARSQQVLGHYAYETFEPGNRRLIEWLDWQTNSFVSPVEEEAGQTNELRTLNTLWRSAASPDERHVIYTALRHLLAHSSRPSAVL